MHQVFTWKLSTTSIRCCIIFQEYTQYNNTTACVNWPIVFILVTKINSKKVCEKMENTLTFEKVLLACNRNAELLRLEETIFDSKVSSLRRMRKKNSIILKSLQKKMLPFFVWFVCRYWHLSCQISIESVRKIVICSLTVLCI